MRLTMQTSTSLTKDAMMIPLLENVKNYGDLNNNVFDDVHNNEDYGILEQQTKGFLFKAKGQTLNIDKGTLRDIRKQNGGGLLKNLLHSTAIECNPEKLSASPDVGVLVCGIGRYCMESADSKLGGLCTAIDEDTNNVNRQLQDENVTLWKNAYSLFCEENAENCECTGVDEEEYLLTIDCSFSNTCKNRESTCGVQSLHCYNATYALSFSGNYQYSRSFCYYDSQPYDQQVCYSANVNYTNWECEMIFDGTTCSSCEVKFVDIGFCDSDGECTYVPNNPCYYFDCTNTDLGKTGKKQYEYHYYSTYCFESACT